MENNSTHARSKHERDIRKRTVRERRCWWIHTYLTRTTIQIQAPQSTHVSSSPGSIMLYSCTGSGVEGWISLRLCNSTTTHHTTPHHRNTPAFEKLPEVIHCSLKAYFKNCFILKIRYVHHISILARRVCATAVPELLLCVFILLDRSGRHVIMDHR